MTEHILEMKNITMTFPGVKALSDVSLEVSRGEIHAICGENGAGKSTLMKVLSGVYPHGTYEGEILFENAAVGFQNIRESERLGIVIIHQELALSPHLSIAENIFLNNEITKNGFVNWNKTNQEAQKLMAKVGLSEDPNTLVKNIGVGKQQLVEIAKALSKRVKLLILDEPTAALNDADSEHLLELLRQFKHQGMTSIIISHKLNEIAAIADKTTIIRDGLVIETLDMHNDSVNQERIIKGMVGREMNNRYPSRESQIGEELFRVEEWTVHHPDDSTRVVVDNVSFNVKAGEIVGLAGIMGAGRTELARSIFGHSWGIGISGRTFIKGKEFQLKTIRQAIDAGIAYSTEDRKRYGLNLIDDIKRNISMASLKNFVKFGLVNANEEYRIANEYRTSMNIKAPSPNSIVGKLSGGNQQKVVLSQWINVNPDLLILDEPTRGIDVGAKYEIYTIIQELASQGKAILMISSELSELIGICDRIYAISEGRLTGEVEKTDFSPELLMKYMTMTKDEMTKEDTNA
jgi:putative multiple sugar transport system ATP-binding protein